MSLASVVESKSREGLQHKAASPYAGSFQFPLFPLLGVAAPAVLVYGILLLFSRNRPMYDDFHAILEFAVTYRGLHGALPHLQYIVAAQHDEYKLIFEHALVALELALTGHVNFVLLEWIGNACLLAIFGVLWCGLFPEATDRSARALFMVPVSWLVFQLNYVENLNWAMCGLQNLAVIAFSLTSLLLLQRPRQRAFAGACLAGVLVTFSSANGFLVLPAALAFLLPRRQFRRAVVATLVFATAALAYLYGYHRLRYTPSGVSVPGRLIVALSFFGAAVENMHRRPIPYASLALGAALCLLGLYALRTRVPEKHPFLGMLGVWILLTSVPLASLRAEPTYTGILSGRYKIYSDLALILLYAAMLQGVRSIADLQRRKLFWATMAAAVLFSLSSDVAGWRFLQRRLVVSQVLTPDYKATLAHARASHLFMQQ